MSQEIAKPEEMRMEERLSAGEDDPSDTQLQKNAEMFLQVRFRNLLNAEAVPNVTHDTATITTAVGHQDQDGQG